MVPVKPAASKEVQPQNFLHLLMQQSGLTIALAFLLTASWLFLAWLTMDMSHPFAQLTMPESARWSIANLLAIFVMWAAMMAAMMLPSALPMVLTFAHLSRRQSQPLRTAGFVTAYLVVWSAFSVVATAVQWCAQRLGWVDPMLVSRSVTLTALLLIIAGLYQFSRLKQVCLGRCRTPVGFLIAHWRAGTGGAFMMGLRHGLDCTGCCWALMALLFVGGAMNLAWVAALSVAVAIEKLVPHGDRFARILGGILLATGIYKLLVLVS